MAKRKKNAAAIGVPTQSPMNTRIDTGIENAENGFIVRISGESGGDGGYFSKRFIATSEPKALRIAHQGMRGMLTKGKTGKKKGGKGKSRGKAFSARKG